MVWLIGNAVLALIEHPDYLEALRQDPTRIDAVLEETLRWDSPVQLLMRLTTKETEVGGVGIPKGSMVMPLLASANRDEERFPDGESFDPERKSQGHLAFGFGNHFCLGASLARAEIATAVGTFITRFPRFDFAEDPVFRPSLFLRGLARLPLTIG